MIIHAKNRVTFTVLSGNVLAALSGWDGDSIMAYALRDGEPACCITRCNDGPTEFAPARARVFQMEADPQIILVGRPYRSSIS